MHIQWFSPSQLQWCGKFGVCRNTWQSKASASAINVFSANSALPLPLPSLLLLPLPLPLLLPWPLPSLLATGFKHLKFRNSNSVRQKKLRPHWLTEWSRLTQAQLPMPRAGLPLATLDFAEHFEKRLGLPGPQSCPWTGTKIEPID